MDSADLRIFQAVAREGSITKAAQKLGYVQSNVTARVQQLESDLGSALFIRHNRGMTLSASGITLLGYADRIVGLLDEASRALSGTNEPSGALRIGSTQTAAAVRLPKLLSAYYERYPNVQLSLEAGHTQVLIEKVLRYELEGAFIGKECDHPELDSFTAFREEMVVASAPGIMDLEAALKKPVIAFNSGCSYREVLEQWLRSNGLTQAVIMEFGMLEAIIGGVVAGLGISLLPRTVVSKPESEGALRTHEVPESFRLMKTDFITRKDSFMSSALQAFIGLLPRNQS